MTPNDRNTARTSRAALPAQTHRRPSVITRAARWLAVCGLVLMALGVASPNAFAQAGARIDISLAEYEALLAATVGQRQGSSDVTVGPASITFNARNGDGGMVVDATANFVVEVRGDGPRDVALGVPARTMTVDGSNANWASTPGGAVWTAPGPGNRRVNVTWTTMASPTSGGWSVALRLPPAATSTVNANVPGGERIVGLSPASDVTVVSNGNRTTVNGTITGALAAQLTWRAPLGQDVTVSRAIYTGTIDRDAASFEVTFDVTTSGATSVPLLPGSVALSSAQVDGRDAPVAVTDGWFHVPLPDAGRHRVVLGFEAPVQRPDGAPRVAFDVPQVPVSQFSVAIDGDKEVTIAPAARVERTVRGDQTVATAYVPLTNSIVMSWAEALPETEVELRANATVVTAAHAEEGVLSLHAWTTWEITRGETTQLSYALSGDAQVVRVSSPSGGVGDWRMTDGEGEQVGLRILTVFLDREVSEEYRVDIEYERPLGDTPQALPMLSAQNVSRQRGMVALLADREVALEPVTETELVRVGENELPPFVRDATERTIAHTWRYSSEAAGLVARATTPTREPARFDVQVDTLVSISDVTTSAVALVDVNVKSGGVEELMIALPEGVNVLAVSAPSMREQTVTDDGGNQIVNVFFTREMQGTFRVELSWERINSEDAGVLPVPLPRVRATEVEQGRIAVEARAAVEVRAESVAHLSTIDIAELPQQIVRRTTNPILLAFKYVQTEPMPELSLAVTRHVEVDTQAAIIDTAALHTLVTKDGFSVTVARYRVRNSREQFLRVRLPEGAEVWSATVDGELETPALADSDAARPEVLINIVRSTEGFDVELVYATRGSSLGFGGAWTSVLPEPDMVVTRTTWNVDVPADLSWRAPGGDLDAASIGIIDGEQRDEAAYQMPRAGVTIELPDGDLRRFAFEGLYVHQQGEAVSIRLPYVAPSGASAGTLAAWAGPLVFWLAMILFVLGRIRTGGWIPLIVIGVCLSVAAMALLGASVAPWMWLSPLALVIILIIIASKRLSKVFEVVAEDPEPVDAEVIDAKPAASAFRATDIEDHL